MIGKRPSKTKDGLITSLKKCGNIMTQLKGFISPGNPVRLVEAKYG